MRGLVVVAVVVLAGQAPAEPAKPACQRAALTITKLLEAGDKAQVLLARRCDKDRWSRDTQACFTAASSRADAQHCLDKLTKAQRKQLEGDADRLGDPKLTRWLLRRVLVARALPPPTITLAVLEPMPTGNLEQARD